MCITVGLPVTSYLWDVDTQKQIQNDNIIVKVFNQPLNVYLRLKCTNIFITININVLDDFFRIALTVRGLLTTSG